MRPPTGRPHTSYHWEEPPADDVRSLPLPDAVREVLLSLTWPQETPRSRRGGGRNRIWDGEALSATEATAAHGDRLPPVGSAHLLTAGGGTLPQRWFCFEMAAGRIGLVLAPEADPSSAPTRISWSKWDGQPLPPPETARRPHSGDSTDLTARGVRVHVRAQWPGATRLLWLDPSGHSVRRVELNSPEPPLPAVERLVRDPELLPEHR